MNDDFNWLEYAEPVESAPPEVEGRRRGLRRFLPRLRRPRLRWPRLRGPRLGRPRLRRPSLPSLRLPRLSLRRWAADEAQESIADLVAVQEERPEAELDERLQALRQRGPVTVTTQQALSDVDELLVTPELQSKPGGVISAAALSKAQQQQVEMLKDIVAGPLDTGEESAGGRGRGLVSLGGFSVGAAPRMIAAAFVIFVVCLPFVSSDFAEGELPPADFGEDRPDATTFYDLLDNLSSDDYVLVAFEYGPTAAGEMDQLADLLLRQIFAQRAAPLIVSSNPIAIVHAQNIIAGIKRSVADTDLSLEHGSEYFILRYLPGGALGLRELNENFADVARVSAKGILTGLDFESLDEMTLTLLIAESVDDVRNWVEQALPRGEEGRLLLATSYAAGPLAQSYADSTIKIAGPVAGARDAYTYAEKLESSFGALRPARLPAWAPQQEPQQAPPQEPEVAPVAENAAGEAQAESPLPTSMAPATATWLPTFTPLPSLTPLPTETPPPTATPTSAPTATIAPTATAEPVLMVDVIDSPQRVRIRRGPTTADDILQLADTGDSFEVLGTNGDGSWYQIELENGLEGWIAAFLVEERWVAPGGRAGGGEAAVEDGASARADGDRTVLRRAYFPVLGKNERQISQALPPDTGIDWEFVLLRERADEIPRLQALTLGTLAAALTIFIGNIAAALRAFRARPRRSAGATERQ